MSEQVRPYPSDPMALSDEEFAAAYGDHYPPLPYEELLRAGPRHGAWWLALGSLILLVAFFGSSVVWLIPFVVALMATGSSLEGAFAALADLSDPTPAGLAWLMVSLATMIPACWFVSAVVHGVRPRWLSSVGPRIRWRYLGACLAVSVLVLVVTVVVSTVLPAGDIAGTDVQPGLNDFTATTGWFLLVVVLLVPFQAAGEEYLFRGYLTQALGGLFRRRWVAVVVPALLFALAHGSQSAPVFIDRLSFGLIAGLLVVWTGGLEAAIAMHVLNNVLAFGYALALGDLAESLVPTGGSWWMLPTTLTQSLLYLWLAVLLARRMGVATQATGRALVASQARV